MRFAFPCFVNAHCQFRTQITVSVVAFTLITQQPCFAVDTGAVNEPAAAAPEIIAEADELAFAEALEIAVADENTGNFNKLIDWNSLVDMAISGEDQYLNALEQVFDTKFADPAEIPEYADFVKSPQYAKWAESRK